MAECDANYARLKALAPALCSQRSKPASSGVGVGVDVGVSRGGDVGAEAVPLDQTRSQDQSRHPAELFSIELGESNVRVVIELVERSRYTSLLRFTQEATGIAEQFAPPTMCVRLYHDARSAEVVEVRNENRFKEVYEYPNPKMRSRDEKFQVNRFLGEYLSICLRYGLAEPVELAVDSLR